MRTFQHFRHCSHKWANTIDASSSSKVESLITDGDVAVVFMTARLNLACLATLGLSLLVTYLIGVKFCRQAGVAR